MAQVEMMQRKRKPRFLQSNSIDCLDFLVLPKPLLEPEKPQMDTLTTCDLQVLNSDFMLDLDTSTQVPIELILDAHFAESAVQAEVLHCEEEHEKLMQEFENLRKQREAAAQEQAAAQAAEAAYWQNTSTFASVATSSPSSVSPFGLSSMTTVVSYPMAGSSFDQQSFLTTGAAQTQWTQNNQQITTTEIVPR
jgi:hypothetical protein